ncbi:MAG: cell surface protein SprA [Flavobacteriaceae bacterium]|nr:cell surface protein SprA [Flavobacteriaceae bacterium]
MTLLSKYIKLVLSLGLFFLIWQNAVSQTPTPPPAPQVKDTLKKDSIPPLKYFFRNHQKGSLYLKDPSKITITYDSESGHYLFLEKIGDYYMESPYFMTQKEYQKYRLNRDMIDYFKSKISNNSRLNKNNPNAKKDELPTYYVNSKFFESIFGGNSVVVNPQGTLLLKLGVLYQKVDNPQLSENNRKSTTFNFDQQISASLTAQIGRRLKVSANFDTQSTFNFQNLVKLEYTPDADDIIRKIEVGNISMPIKNSLIKGAQNLIGVKTELQFGKTTVTTVLAQQQSETRSVSAQGGASINEFNLKVSDYDANKHFFLSQKFRDNYNTALANLPLINSGINITRVEVWVSNRNSTTQNVRNIVALSDLGELKTQNIGNSSVIPSGSQDASNDANNLNSLLLPNGPIREISSVGSALAPFNMSQGNDYSVLENARSLQLNNDFTFNPQLGYITLNSRLAQSDVLAVSFEYTENGNVYKVGEFSDDGIAPPNNLAVKLLRSEVINTNIPLWNLMMKNVYSLNAYQMQRDEFRLEVLYEDDNTGVPVNILQGAQTVAVQNKTLLNILKLDRLDQSSNIKPDGDGFFDYIEGITVNSEKGYITFPVIEPFGKDLDAILTDPADSKFVFNELYAITQSEAVNNFQQKNKYLIKGYYKSAGTQGIPLGVFNAQPGSVVVTSGGRQLVEGVDYVVDYQIGNVQIINPTLIASKAPVQVSVENNNGFSQQQRSFFGLDIAHKFSDKFVAGATILNLKEKPLTQKIQFGSEPVNNTLLGLNFSYSTTVPKLTKLVNKLPFIDTNVPSKISVRGEFAYIIPGSPKEISQQSEATSYIDDFEGSQIPISLNSPRQWFLASTPQNQTDPSLINLGGDNTDLSYGKNRAKLSWYNIDRLFYGGSSLKPNNIDDNELSRAEIRRVDLKELFPQQDVDFTQSTVVRTFDLAYFPQERGSYNFDATNIDADGNLTNPENRWAGIMRSLSTTDFEQANVEYIQFWVMDPFEHYSITESEGFPKNHTLSDADFTGELYINLGNISEDILKDGRKMFENGLPQDGQKDPSIINETIWSDIPLNQSLLYAFDEKDQARTHQDLGLDGLNDSEEALRFSTFLNQLPPSVETQMQHDPASDNYQYFRGSALDNAGATILNRYKNYTNTQGNSPTANLSTESFPTSATSFPDVEDIDKDQTMNTVESYFQYKISFNKNDLVVGRNNIVDKREVNVSLSDGNSQTVSWYQIRIPIKSPDAVINGITNFNSIRFMRLFLTKFKIPVVLRFGEFELVRGDWRRFTRTLPAPPSVPINLDGIQLQNFVVGVVNIQENEGRYPIKYILPPGIIRERLQGSTTIQRQNEQSLSVKIKDLAPQETRAVFKNVSMDLRMFKKLKLFIHAESAVGQTEVQDNELKAIIRLGSDIDENYYQIEVPLSITAFGALSAEEVWPELNNINLALDKLGKLKLLRFESNLTPNTLFPAIGAPPVFDDLGAIEVRVFGNPNLANIKTVMLGIKNTSFSPKSAEIWFNELRVAQFDNKGGWSANINADGNLADFADISFVGSASSIGFGSIDQRVSERSQEDVKQYNIITNINLGKLFPKKWGVNLPMNYSTAEEFRDPKYDPQLQDILFADAKNTNSNDSRDYTQRTSISFMNVKKDRTDATKQKRPYDIENISVSYAYNQTYHRDYNTKLLKDQNVRTSANYNYTFKPYVLEPFKKTKFFDKKSYLKFIRDLNINLVPTSIAINTNIRRTYNEQLSRDLIGGLPDLPTLKQRYFLFDWDYNVAYDLTKSLDFNFRAANNYVYDDFLSDDVRIFDSFFKIGRPQNYHQSLNATYKLPLDKIPYLNFITSTFTYTADFDWQASSKAVVESVGNSISNANTNNFSATLNLTKFYKTVGVDKLRAGASKNKKDTEKQTKVNAGNKAVNTVLDIVTSIKKIGLSYTSNNGTFLPGYIPEIGFLGRNNFSGGLAPTFGFVFGSQNDIRDLALTRGWLISRSASDPIFNKTYTTSHYDKLDLTANIKPLKDLQIDLIANRIFTSNESQQIDIIDNAFSSAPINTMGNFSISRIMIKTSFDNNGDDTFATFKANRSIIANRLAQKAGLATTDGFGETSQQVLLPAFLAAYSGKEASKISLNSFRNTPVPNWKISYRGLMKIKWFKENFSSFTLSNAYRGSYGITGYTNNLQFDINNPYGNSNKNKAANFNSELLISSVNLIEDFSPLIKIDFRMKNAFSFKAEIKRDKSLNLNFNNNTLTEIRGKEYVFGIGYRIKDLQLRIKTGNSNTTYKGDLNLKADLTIRDNLTVIRALDKDNNQVTGGQKIVAFKFLADYNLTKNIMASFFYDQNTSRFAISTTFPRKSISTGLSLRYTFGN